MRHATRARDIVHVQKAVYRRRPYLRPCQGSSDILTCTCLPGCKPFLVAPPVSRGSGHRLSRRGREAPLRPSCLQATFSHAITVTIPEPTAEILVVRMGAGSGGGGLPLAPAHVAVPDQDAAPSATPALRLHVPSLDLLVVLHQRPPQVEHARPGHLCFVLQQHVQPGHIVSGTDVA